MYKRRSGPCSVVYLLCSILLSLCLYGESSSAFELVLKPLEALQGETLTVKVLGIDREETYRCFFNGVEYPIYPDGEGKLRALIGLASNFKPGEYQLMVIESGDGEPEIEKRTFWIKEGRFPVQVISFTKEKKRLIEEPKNRIEQRLIREGLETETHKQLWTGIFLLPVTGRISGPYGARRVDEKGDPYWIHKGIDIVAKKGREVLAANSGKVVLAREDFKLHGKTILIDHGQGVMSIYLHLASIMVKEGDDVSRGQVIGLVGHSGLATGAHLHFGIYVHGVAVNPSPWFEVEY